MEQRREARLRPEYASWYPGVTVAGWLPVTTIVRAVTRQLLDGEPRGAPRSQVGPRILDECHFLVSAGCRARSYPANACRGFEYRG